MNTSPLLIDPSRRDVLPQPIARRAAILAEESERHGAHTTPDELADLIEATFDFVFRLWVAEFARAGALDDDAARYVVQALTPRMLLGPRIGMARTLRDVFVRKGLDTAVRGLVTVDFGAHDDKDHPVAQLLRFRNGFAHGSFSASLREIERHRALVEDLLERLPALVEQPVCVVRDDGIVYAFRAIADPIAMPPGARLPESGRPFVAAHDGSEPLDLFPLWIAESTGDDLVLTHPGDSTTQGLQSFFEREGLREYARRWQDELDGLFSHDDLLRRRVTRSLTSAERDDLDDAVARKHLVLVEAHPGCGKAAALVTLLDDSSLRQRFNDVSTVVLAPGEPATRATTFANMLLRSAERALDLAPRALESTPPEGKGGHRSRGSDRSALERVQMAIDALEAAKRTILVLIEDAHFGTVLARGESDTLARMVRALVPTNGRAPSVHVVATTHPGAARAPFAHDRKVSLGVPDAPDDVRVRTAVDAALARSPMHRATLATICRREGETPLFAVCDALEQSGHPTVFEPAVEHALTELRPLLFTRRDGGERVWKAFHPMLRTLVSNADGTR